VEQRVARVRFSTTTIREAQSGLHLLLSSAVVDGFHTRCWHLHSFRHPRLFFHFSLALDKKSARAQVNHTVYQTETEMLCQRRQRQSVAGWLAWVYCSSKYEIRYRLL